MLRVTPGVTHEQRDRGGDRRQQAGRLERTTGRVAVMAPL
jgi:hypothetical protein